MTKHQSTVYSLAGIASPHTVFQVGRTVHTSLYSNPSVVHLAMPVTVTNH